MLFLHQESIYFPGRSGDAHFCNIFLLGYKHDRFKAFGNTILLL